jgi:hypothetical protein
MGLFDLFSSQPAQNAAAAQTQGLTQGYGMLSGLTGQAQGALSQNYGQGIGALNQNYASALQPFQQNYATAQQGTNALGNALGLNGASGNAAATAAFWNNPAIQSQLDIGSQNVLRNQAASGQLNSGKTNVDLQNYGQQVASQGWNNYINQLQPYLGYSQNAAQGIGGLYSGLGNQLAGQYGQLGQGQAGLLSGQGQAAFGANAGIGNANANAAMAPVNASANMWGVGLGLLGAATGSGAAGKAGQAVGQFGTNLFNNFNTGAAA